jgi:hypothetical protein
MGDALTSLLLIIRLFQQAPSPWGVRRKISHTAYLAVRRSVARCPEAG